MISTSDRLKLITAVVADKRCQRAHIAIAHLLFAHHYNSETGRCDPSVLTLANEAAMGRRHARQAILDLQQWGYLSVETGGGMVGKFGKTNAYTPCSPEHGMLPSAEGKGMLHRPSDGPQSTNPLLHRASKPRKEPRKKESELPPASSTDPTLKHPGGKTERASTPPSRARGRGRPDGQDVPAPSREFDEFRDAYPKGGRVDGRICRAKYQTLIAGGDITHERLVAAARRYARSKNVRDGFICNMTTWLNQERWLREEVSASDASDDAPSVGRSRAAI